MATRAPTGLTGNPTVETGDRRRRCRHSDAADTL